MNNFTANYEKILQVLKSNFTSENFIFQKRKPKLSDIEPIAVDLTAKYMSIDSECQLFRVLDKQILANQIERSVYNRRKRNRSSFIEKIRRKIASKFNEFEDVFLIDSMPLEVCKLSRSSREKICKEDFYSAPDKGFCASQEMYFYGYKLHAVCSLNRVFESIDITKASVDDVHFLKDVQTQMSDCVLLGDKRYLSSSQQLDLFEFTNIKL